MQKGTCTEEKFIVEYGRKRYCGGAVGYIHEKFGAELKRAFSKCWCGGY